MDRVGATISFMGKGIVEKCVICLCHLINEIKLFNSNNEVSLFPQFFLDGI